jgi:uncharacterized protein
MEERDRYPHGVPCWVDKLQPDVEAALAFYGELFGWEFVGPGPMPPDPAGRYFVARVRGLDVAGVGSQPPDAPPVTSWSTYVSVASADEAGEKARAAGGRVIVEPFDAPPAGRMAVLADPEGAVFCVWEARERKGAQLVNDAGAWSWSGLNTRDPERAKAFYAAVFGWEIETMGTGDAEYTMFRVPGYVGGRREQPVSREVVAGMSPMTGDRDDAPHWSIDFWVDDVDAIARKTGELGGRAVVAAYDTPIARQAVVADPQGAMFSVSKVRVPTEAPEEES